MYKKEFSSPKEAYDFLNSWTFETTSYEAKYKGKQVTSVVISLDFQRPILAEINYKTKDGKTGTDCLDLKGKTRESPKCIDQLISR